jgi:hypothetical protein
VAGDFGRQSLTDTSAAAAIEDISFLIRLRFSEIQGRPDTSSEPVFESKVASRRAAERLVFVKPPTFSNKWLLTRTVHLADASPS